MGPDTAEDAEQLAREEFLVREGLDLLAAYRIIKSEEARRSVLRLVAAIVQAETDAAQRGRD